MGFVGPDQPWTRETAGKSITEEEKSCPKNRDFFSLSEFATPKKIEAGKVVVNDECFKTGKIFEAMKAGNPRMVQWCCPKGKMFLPKRDLTRPEMEQYGGQCGLMRGASGEYEPEPGQKIPVWRDPNSYIGSAYEPLGVKDNGYELYCYPWRSLDIIIDPITGEKKIAAHMLNMKMAPVSLDPAVSQQHDEARQQEIARRESIIQESAVPEGTFIERYGFPLLLIAGTIGIGVTAALFKRFSVASKQAKDARAIAVSGGSL